MTRQQTDSGMILIAGTARIAPENLATIRPHLQDMVRASRAEPGCLHYSLAFDVLEENRINVCEAFVDRAAFLKHQSSTHMLAWQAAIGTRGLEERNYLWFKVGSYRPLTGLG